LVVSQGAPLTGLTLSTGPGGPPIALPGSITTDTVGMATLRFHANHPGHPRPNLDGQVYVIAFYVNSVSPANLQGQITVRVFETFSGPANPRWADVRDILTPYYRLYPAMRFIDLHDSGVVHNVASNIAAALRRAETDQRYMPVTRDLSRDKKAFLLRWLDSGAPV
jgi:hypothetical protein